MKLLFLAPQPFFQERGTPIAVRLALQVLAKRFARNGGEVEIDLIAYHEGEDIKIPGVSIHRIWAPSFLKNIGPGISIKKLLCDILFLFKTVSLILKRGRKHYDLIHAVEESVFIAVFIRLFLGIPYLYDMDSSLGVQLTDKWFLLRPLKPLMELLEGGAMRSSLAVVPMCDALAAVAESQGAKETHILRDVSLVAGRPEDSREADLRSTLGLAADADVVMYIGNLESYQGIDLLLEAFAEHSQVFANSHLIVIGGVDAHVEHYKGKAKQLGVQNRAHILGPRPVGRLSEYISQATVLAAPRVKGTNTPMKIYSYLHSGKPIVATNLPTHTQVLSTENSVLCPPRVRDFAEALTTILSDKAMQARLGEAAKELAEKNYTFEVFEKRLNEIYDRVSSRMNGGAGQKNRSLAESCGSSV